MGVLRLRVCRLLPGRCLRGFRPHVHAFALRPEEREEFHGLRVSPAEPMGGVGIELRGFAGGQDDVVFPQAEAELSLEHVDPLVALMRAQVWEAAVASRREQMLEGL